MVSEPMFERLLRDYHAPSAKPLLACYPRDLLSQDRVKIVLNMRDVPYIDSTARMRKYSPSRIDSTSVISFGPRRVAWRTRLLAANRHPPTPQPPE